MPKRRPACSISLRFDSGRTFKIDLYRSLLLPGRKVFEVKFTDDQGVARIGSGSITRLVDRLRRLLVKELG